MIYTVGIQQNIPMNLLKIALIAVLNDTYVNEYATELSASVFVGQNRIKKSSQVISKIAARNPLLPYLKEHKEEVLVALQSDLDKGILLTSLTNTAYTIGYHTTSMLGKYFHVQDSVQMELIVKKLSAYYTANETMTNALYCVLPMMIDAKMLSRPKPSVYEMIKQFPKYEVTKEIYKQSFFYNNPMLTDEYDYSNNPYFEFIGNM